MITLTIISLAFGLTLAPAAPVAPAAAPSYAVQARQRLDRFTTAASSRLRTLAVARALTEGLVRFNTNLTDRMENPQQQVAYSSAAHQKP